MTKPFRETGKERTSEPVRGTAKSKDPGISKERSQDERIGQHEGPRGLHQLCAAELVFPLGLRSED